VCENAYSDVTVDECELSSENEDIVGENLGCFT
jgi:hypothetical protein